MIPEKERLSSTKVLYNTLSCLVAKFRLKFSKQLFLNRERTYKVAYLTTLNLATKNVNMQANLSPRFYLGYISVVVVDQVVVNWTGSP